VKATARRISQSPAGFPVAAIGVSLALLAPGAARAEVKRLQFPVSGMHSPLASRGVEEAIRQLPGVARVSADRGTGRVEVEAESQRSLNLQEVRTRAARAGFPVSGDLDVLARGRFETGAERRLTFKVSGTSYGWQVLESGTLLEIIRNHPGLRGEFVVGFRLFEKPPWNRPAISLAEWEAVPAAVPPAATAPPPAARPSAGPVAKKPVATKATATVRKPPAVEPAKKKRKAATTPDKP
jgi:copper chaperone CopZ